MYYNLFYKNTKINSKPLTEHDLIKVYTRDTIYKHDNNTNKVYSIPVKKIRRVKCVMI